MNSDTLSKMSMIDLLHSINMNMEECLYQILSKCSDNEKTSRCKKMKCCYDCLAAWLSEGDKRMYINGEWLEEPEVKAKLKENEEKYNYVKDTLAASKALLTQIRAYFGETIGWIDLFEEEYQKIFERDKI